MSVAVQTSFYQSYQYGSYSSKTNRGVADFDKEYIGKATSRTTSSNDGKNIGIMTIGSKGYIAKYADSSTEADPVVKVGDYEVRVNDVDPKDATEIEMFALMSYMDDKGLIENTGMKSFGRMRTYSQQAEYNGFCSGIAGSESAWTQNRDWTSILENAKESYFMMPQAYQHGLNCQKIIDGLERWCDNALLRKAQSGDTTAAKEIIEKNVANGKIQKAMDGNEFIRMQGEIIQKNHDEAMKNWKSTRERLLEQDPAAESKWYMYGDDSKRYTFDEFCEFMDKMYAEQRANAPAYRNQYLEMANQSIQQRNGVGSAEKRDTVDASNFKEVETENYKLVPEPGIGGLRIYVNGESAGVFKPEHLKIQEDAQTGTKVLISEMPGLNSSWYDAIPVNEELEGALSDAMGVDEVPHKALEGYYIGTHAETGIRYVMRPGDEGKGGQVLLCNAVDEARYKALGEEYARRYPNLVKSPEEGLIYANFEIRGMAHRGANGIVMTHPDNISYNDNSDPKKNWSAMIGENAWNLLLSWFRNHTLDSDKMTGFRYWDGIFNEVGGTYERVWSDDELKQGYLYQ